MFSSPPLPIWLSNQIEGIEMGNFYTTKVLMEVEVQHQFDPKSGIETITERLNVPAVKSVKVLSAQSDYQLHSDALEKMVPIALE